MNIIILILKANQVPEDNNNFLIGCKKLHNLFEFIFLFLANEEWAGLWLFISLFHENQLIGPKKYIFGGSKSSQNASIFHKKNDGGVNFFIGYPYTAGYGGIKEY